MSLICASLTWLRDFKRSSHELALKTAAGEATDDEPDWVLEQMLRLKRDSLRQNWEESEERLQKIRAKEKQLAERASTRRRREEPLAGQKYTVDEEAEFLLGDGGDGDGISDDDPLSMLSKETRDQMAQLGLIGPKANVEEDEVEDEIKVAWLVWLVCLRALCSSHSAVD